LRPTRRYLEEVSMACCSHCEGASDLFNRRTARRDLRRYRSRGPSATTRLLLDALVAQRSGDRTLLDIGGGVGAIASAGGGAGRGAGSV